MQQNELAKLLDISPAMVSRLHKRGMPIDCPERAKRWRKRHLEPGRVKGARFDPTQPTALPESKQAVPKITPTAACDPLLATVESAGAELDQALMGNDQEWSELMTQQLRGLLRQLPDHARPCLTLRVWLAMLEWLISPECEVFDSPNKSEILTPGQFGYRWHKSLFAEGVMTTEHIPSLGANALSEACDWNDVSINGWPHDPEEDLQEAA